MIREDIQDYIIEHLNKGWTLRETVEGIEEEFGVRMSKQNASKFYLRFNKRKLKMVREIPDAKLCGEVYIRRPYMSECVTNEMLLEKFTAYKIKRLILDHSSIIEGMYEELADKVADLYIAGRTIPEICEETSYVSADGKYRIETSEEVVSKMIKETIQEVRPY